jgi:hypothetical protein
MKKTALKLSTDQLLLLSRLAEPWRAATFSKQTATKIQLCDDSVIEVTAEGVDVAPLFECFRLSVVLGREKVEGEPPIAFVNGAQRIIILQSEEWLETENHPDATDGLLGNYAGTHHIGAPGRTPSNVEHHCTVDSGILLVAPTGERLLIRCDAVPCWLTITNDDECIEQDLAKHGLRELPYE